MSESIKNRVDALMKEIRASKSIGTNIFLEAFDQEFLNEVSEWRILNEKTAIKINKRPGIYITDEQSHDEDKKRFSDYEKMKFSISDTGDFMDEIELEINESLKLFALVKDADCMIELDFVNKLWVYHKLSYFK